MKRLYLLAATIAVAVLLSGCPPQKQDICPGFAHCSVLSWSGAASQIYRGANCGSLTAIAAVQPTSQLYVDTNVTSGQSYCYQVRSAAGASNSFTVTIP